MTNQEKFIQIFGIDAWQHMIEFSGLDEKFKEYWKNPHWAMYHFPDYDRGAIQEALDLSNEYEQRQNEIKVGDRAMITIKHESLSRYFEGYYY